MADVLQLAREVKLIRSGLPLDELVRRSRLIDQLEKQFGDVKSEVKQFKRVSTEASKEAKKATKQLNAYQKEFNKLKNQVTKDGKKFLDELNKKTKPLQDAYKKIDKGVQRLTKGLDKYIGAASLGFGIAGVAISFMALWASEGNQTAFDRQVNAFQVSLSNQGSFNQLIQTRFKKLREEFEAYKKKAEKTFDYQSQDLIQIKQLANRAQKLANDGLYESRVRMQRLNDTLFVVRTKADKAEVQNKQQEVAINALKSQAFKAEQSAKTAQSEAQQARVGVKLVDSKATTAQLQAKTAQTEAIQARVGVKLVDSKATIAQVEAKQAQVEAKQAQVQAVQANAKAVSLQPSITQAVTTANQALAVAKGIKVTTVESTPGTGTTTANQQKMSQSEFNQYLRQNGIILKVDAAQTTAQTALEVASKGAAEPIGNKALGVGSTALSLGANNQAQLNRLDAEFKQFKLNPPSLLDPRVPELQQKIRERETVDNQALQKLNEIQAGNALLVPALIAGFTPAMQAAIGRGNQNLLEQLPDKTATAVQNAPCSGRGCGGRTAARVDGLADELGALRNQVNGLPNTVGNVVNAGANALQIPLLNTINNKLGAPVPGGIGGLLQKFSDSFEKFAEWAHLDRILNVLTFTATVHNAYMLSNALTQTFFSMISNVLAVVGIKDKDNNPLDINSIVGRSLDALFKSILGTENVDGIKTEWKKYSRIYQAAANIVFSLQSIGYSILGAMEVLANWVAVIGNALKAWGVIAENAYKWMNPTVDFQNRFFTTLNNVENVVSNIDQVAQETLSIQETVGQLGKQKEELTKALGEVDGSRQTAGVPEAAKVLEASTMAKTVSASPAIATSDKVKPEV